VKRTETRLADGRRLIYFDRDDGAVRDQLDTRQLTASGDESELRYDELLDQWVIVAAHRQERTFQPAENDCPLCPSTSGHATEVPAPDYDVVVFENRFPALHLTGSVPPIAEESGIRPGLGVCEVVAFTSVHDSSFAELQPSQVELVIDAWIDRTQELSAVPGVEQVFCFENRGAEIGVTLAHPHGQIYAYPFVTPRTARILQSSLAYDERTGRNLADDVLASALAVGSRIVTTTEEWTAFVPRAARWPYEIQLYPNRRVPDLAALSDRARAEFGTIYSDVLRRLDRLFVDSTPYISALHQAPVRQGREMLALHLELFTSRRAPGKLKYLAGSEAGMDAFSNDVQPEVAAERLRALA
jgi:UDPglucose--hexose-1-phosphate uridylyltransferase